MAFQAKTGNFTQPVTTNASFAVTGVGFTPKALILYATNETAVAISTNWAQHYGMATTTTNRVGISTTQLTASGTAARAHDSTKCFIVVSSAGVTTVAADLVSFDVDGFTLNFSTVDTTARVIGYQALGGADLTNAFIKAFLPAASNTAQAFTGVGFKPDAAVFISAQVGAATQTDTAAIGISLGFAKSTTARAGIEVNPGGATESVQKTSKLIEKSSGGAAITLEGDFTSFDADGFTITFGITTSSKEFFALCLKGGQYNVTSFNQKTTTGSQAITGIGFQPVGIMLASINLVTAAAIVTTSSRLSFGTGTASTARASIWAGGGNVGIQDNDTDTGKIINMITEGASPTTNASADLTSLDTDGETLNWATADTTAREIVQFSFGSNPVVGTTPTVFYMPYVPAFFR